MRPRKAEAAVKRPPKRLKTFLDKDWRPGLDGSISRAWKGHRVLVAPRGQGWIAKVDGEGGHKLFPRRDAAISAVFRH